MTAPKQRTPEWVEARFDGLGSSDAAVVAGESPYRTPFELWLEKTTRTIPPYPPETRQLMRIGELMEPVLLSLYEEQTSRKVRKHPAMIRSRERPWMYASLDGRVIQPIPPKHGARSAVRQTNRIVEAKWSNARAWRAVTEDQVPDFVNIQVQHAMEVVKADVADVVALVGGDLRIVEIPRDDEMIRNLVTIEERFWRLVQDGIPPEPDGSEGTRRAIVGLHPEDDGSQAPYDPEISRLGFEILRLDAAAREAEAELETHRNALRLVLGAASEYEADGVRITYRKSKDGVRVGWEQVAAGFRRLLLDHGFDPESLNTVESLYSESRPGARVLRVTDRRNAG